MKLFTNEPLVYMDTAVIDIKVDPRLKKQAMTVAEELGLSLSSVVKGLLKHFIKAKTITFGTSREEPTEYLLQALKESRSDIKAGRVSPSFQNAKDAIAWLHKSDKKYASQIRQKVR